MPWRCAPCPSPDKGGRASGGMGGARKLWHCNQGRGVKISTYHAPSPHTSYVHGKVHGVLHLGALASPAPAPPPTPFHRYTPRFANRPHASTLVTILPHTSPLHGHVHGVLHLGALAPAAWPHTFPTLHTLHFNRLHLCALVPALVTILPHASHLHRQVDCVLHQEALIAHRPGLVCEAVGVTAPSPQLLSYVWGIGRQQQQEGLQGGAGAIGPLLKVSGQVWKGCERGVGVRCGGQA